MKAIEISIILIFILLIFGAVLTSMEKSAEKVVEAAETDNMEKLTSEALDNLINNPGIPDNWNENGKGTPGLAIVNDDGQIVPNSVSYSKLIALGNDYDKLIYENSFDSKIHSSMELKPKDSIVSSVKIGENNEGENIFSLTRLVKCDFYKSYSLKDFESEGKCNKHHNQDEYGCNYFKVFEANLKKSDYYLLIDDSEKYDLSYIVDETSFDSADSWKTAISNRIYLNDEIEFYEDDTSAIVFVHLDKPNPKALLVSVPNDFDRNLLEYDYFRTNDCEFILKAWH
ncbi:hypothetical protein [Methanobrevibacter sp.]|uniref:hypothetical protein n=1 Tax=Methanobrevibacter sp. TaxID=66852 RepID=UPI0025E621B2|nr:hypothetical protein [Methanobrevibacter sp.]MBQ2665511.1 hypothetical protein [Methanobrevibacter sp.]